MADFGAQLQAFAKKTGQKLEDVDVAFKLSVFNRVVKNTRVADPLTWKRPDPDYRGGQMRGGWQVNTGSPSATLSDFKNQVAGLPGGEAAKIRPFSATYLSNAVPYVHVWDETDGIIARAIADARAALAEALRDVDV